jgi:outer membrane protein OmpA-like peptidoglycan-associated protein
MVPDPLPDATVNPARPPARPRWGWVAVAVFVGLVLALLPVGMRWGAQRWLLDHGAATARIDDVDFNPFLGELVVEGVDLRWPDATKIAWQRAVVRAAWWPLVRRRASVEGVALEGAVIDVTRGADGRLSVGGVPVGGAAGAPEQEAGHGTTEGGAPWGIGVHSVDLQDVEVRYRDPGLAVDAAIRRAHLGSLATWLPDAATRVEVEGAVNDGRVAIDGTVRPFSDAPEGSARLRIAGLPLAWLAPLLEGAGITGVDGLCDADMRLEAEVEPASRKVALTMHGTLGLQDLQAAMAQGTLHRLSVSWDGEVQTDVTAAAPPAVMTRGDWVLDDLDLTAAGLRVTEKQATWKGGLDYGTNAAPSGRGLLITGDVAVTDLRAVDPDKGELAAWQTLAVDGVRVEGRDMVEAAALDLTGLRALQGPSGADGGVAPPAVTLGELAVKGIRVWGSSQVEAELVRLDALQARVIRDDGGRLTVARWRPATSPAPAAPPASAAPQPAATGAESGSAAHKMVVRIDRLEVSGDSAFAFADDSVDPPFHLDVDPIHLLVESLDGAQPDQPSPVELRAKIGKYGEVHVAGTMEPFAARPTLSLDGEVTSIDLAPLTSYTAAAVGYRVKSGHLDGDLDVQVDQGALQAESDWRANKLEMVRLTAADQDRLSAGLGLPVNTALALLRDRDDNIRLKVPVAGNLNDPELRLGQTIRKVVTTALVKAINKAVVAYVAVVSSPAAIALAAGKVVSLATAVHFDPVLFAPGDATLDAAAADYLDALAERLDERPGIRLNLCGIAVPGDAQPAPPGAAPGDGEAEIEALRQLAQDRGEAVKDYLTFRRGIAPERLFVCSPEVDEAEGGEARVEISL